MIWPTEIRFHPVNESIIEPQTYLYYIQTPLSRPSEGVCVPFNEATEKSLLDDFKRLWATSFLDNLWIETLDEPYENGVMGKRVIYHMEERPRVKIVDYTGSTKVERTKIDEKMKELGVSLRLDSFLDQAVVRRVQGIVKSFMADKGYEFAEVTSSVEPLPSGPKLVKVVFDVKEGPKVKVRALNFIGNTAVGDGTLGRQMKSTKAKSWLSWITGKGTYQEAKFEEDAEKIVEYYRNKGYIAARVGQPEIKVLEDSADKETRWVQLDVPVDEGPRYRVGEFKFDGNKVVKTEFLEPLFKMKTGDWYTEKNIRKGLEKARELYGGGGYFEFTGYPDLEPVAAAEGPLAGPARADRQRDDADAGRRAVLRQPHHVHRQHHHARQRHPPRGPPRRRRRLQHRVAEVQRQAAQPARLLQAARKRRRASTSRRRRTARTRSTSR